MRRGITVVIPAIPPRAKMLERALASVERQTLRATETIVVHDREGKGAAITRQEGLRFVETEWVAFLDDDDEFMPGHLEALAGCMQQADFVFSWYEVVGGVDPRPQEFGVPWDPSQPRQTTITTLCRTRLAREVGGFVGDPAPSPDRLRGGEDWLFAQRMNQHGRVYHLPVKTWRWHHHSSNTSGMPTW